MKTLSSVLGSGDGLNQRYVLQFRLGALELERTRRARERKAAIGRIKEIDARQGEIDGLMRKYRDTLGVTSTDASAGGETPVSAGSEAGKTRRVLRYGD